eukprot:TRINITY_DN3867_c0_g1_i1.p1 TRINITY_DN3867_c0_g1~~TRINITY_DN3867_c0_g1_i1.p1  ORF type:complete len:347 (+),score=76.48 TRINITY_DN3867_c0_g1_i1:238-1278(+)
MASYEPLSPLLRGALAALPQGSTHAALRSQLRPLFQPSNIDRVLPMIQREAELLVERWRALEDHECHGLRNALELFAVKTVLLGFFACPEHLSDEVVNALVHSVKKLTEQLFYGEQLPHGEVQGQLDEMDGLLAQCTAGGEQGVPSVQGALAADQVRDQSIGLVVAALNTVNELGWIFQYLCACPISVQSALRKEVAGVEGEMCSLEGLSKLRLVGSLVKETLRLHPGIDSFMLRAVRDSTAHGFHIPSGTKLFVSPGLLHHSPMAWDKAADFHPERLLEETPAEFMPFSAGPKGCIATKFAMAEIMLLVATLSRNFTFRFIPQTQDAMVDGFLALPVRKPRKISV